MRALSPALFYQIEAREASVNLKTVEAPTGLTSFLPLLPFPIYSKGKKKVRSSISFLLFPGRPSLRTRALMNCAEKLSWRRTGEGFGVAFGEGRDAGGRGQALERACSLKLMMFLSPAGARLSSAVR